MQTKEEDVLRRDETRDMLMVRRTVVLAGEINRDSLGDVMRRMLKLQAISSDPINMIITSGGGQTDPALEFSDFMSKVLRAPIRGIALGMCGSAATFVMLNCHERLGTPHANFLVHTGTVSKISIPASGTASKHLEHLLAEVRAREERMFKLYMTQLTPPAWQKRRPSLAVRRKHVQALVDRGNQPFNGLMSAEEAIEAGLIERIVTEKLNIFE